MDVGTYSSRNLGNPRKLAWKSGEGGGKEEESRERAQRRGRDRKPKEVGRKVQLRSFGRVQFSTGSKEDECGGRRTASRCYPKLGSNRICGHMDLSPRIMKRLVL